MKDQNISFSKNGFKELINHKEHEILLTSGIGELINSEELKKELINTIKKYFNCEWDLNSEDKEINDNALSRGGNIASSYKINDVIINIITDQGWNKTTVMLSDEY